MARLTKPQTRACASGVALRSTKGVPACGRHSCSRGSWFRRPVARADGPARTRRRRGPDARRRARGLALRGPACGRRPAGVPCRPLRPDERPRRGTFRAPTSTPTSRGSNPATVTGSRRSSATRRACWPSSSVTSAWCSNDRESRSPAIAARRARRRGTPRTLCRRSSPRSKPRGALHATSATRRHAPASRRSAERVVDPRGGRAPGRHDASGRVRTVVGAAAA